MISLNILSTKEMKALDEYTCMKKGISSLQLMEDAGLKIVQCLLEEHPLHPLEDKISILSGLGNNGGDSLVVARHLLEDYDQVDVIIVGNRKFLSPETRINLNRLQELKATIHYFEDCTFMASYEKIIHQSTIIIDGIFGIGLNRDIEGITYEAIKKINESNAYVFSIDIPSGTKGNNGNIAGISVIADFTVIIQNFKIGNLLNSAKDTHGKYKIIDIGIVEDGNVRNKYFLEQVDCMNKLKKRKNDTHKYKYGSVLIIGGSTGMTGAVLMSGISSMRTGSGLVTIAINEKYLDKVCNIYPEIMVKPYKNKSDYLCILSKKQAVAFGPGLGRNDCYDDLVEQLLEMDVPLVIDADGLYHFKSYLDKCSDGCKIIITPHYGEMAMLLDTSSESIKEDPVASVKKITERYGITVVLKGPCTIISHKDQMYFSTLGNPGMATAGCGDVLTGIITSLVGQGLDIGEACKLGVHIHSLSGNLAAEIIGEYSLIATDLINYIPMAFKQIVK